MSPHRRLEEALAEFKGAEEAVLTSTGWMANHAAIGALAGPGDLLLCDKFNHASIIDAARACGARLRTFRHAEAGRLEELLERHRADHDRCLIVTDSLFSMDGDLAPLVEIVDLKHRYDARLLIDEAHATGVLGEHGRGVAEMLGVEGDVDVTVGTLSKALGGLGGFVAGAGELIDVIRNTSRPYIYTTAPPPALAEASLAALAIVRREPQRRRYLLELAGRFREALRSVGLDTGRSAAQIIPALVGPADAAAALSEELLAEGYLIPAIRPPTVPPGTSRLRISLSAGHCWEHLDPLVERLGRWAKEAKKFTP
jgi:8-amino-7-oxononanoate synthase